MTEKDIENIHYNHQNEIQFECHGQRFHYSMDELRKMIVAVWDTQEKLNKAIEFINREIEIIKEQPSKNKSIDEYILLKYNGLLIFLKEVEK